MITMSKRGIIMTSKFKFKEFNNPLAWVMEAKELEVFILMNSKMTTVNSNKFQTRLKMMYMHYKGNRQGLLHLLQELKILTIKGLTWNRLMMELTKLIQGPKNKW
jgi:hypothetical protein